MTVQCTAFQGIQYANLTVSVTGKAVKLFQKILGKNPAYKSPIASQWNRIMRFNTVF